MILDPTAPPPEVSPDPGPDVGSLEGRCVGVRYDRTWRSFEWVRDEWQRALAADGAVLTTWCAGDRVGAAGDRTLAELTGFADRIDVAIAGLGN